MDPIVDEVVKKLGIQLEKVNIFQDTDKTDQYSVCAAPTLIVVDDDGKDLGRKVGSLPKPKLQQWLSDLQNENSQESTSEEVSGQA